MLQPDNKIVYNIKSEKRITGKFDIVDNGTDLWILMQDKNSFFLLDDTLRTINEYTIGNNFQLEKINKISLHPSLEKFIVLSENKLFIFSFNRLEKECPVENVKQIKYSPDGELLWLIEYMNDKRFRIIVRNGNSLSLLASDIYDDELYRSSFIFTNLPEPNRINLNQAAGQDGSMNSFLTFNNNNIEFTKIPQLNDTILPEFRKDKKEFVTILYPDGFATFTYPECKKIIFHVLDNEKEEYCGFSAFYLNENQIVYDINEHLWHIYDIKQKKTVGEFTIEGHEPKETFHYFPNLKDDTDLITDVYNLGSYGKYLIGQYTDNRTDKEEDYLFVIEK